MSQSKQPRKGSEKHEDERAYDGLVREDCPCPRTSCKRHKLCGLCQKHHKKTPPYCERGTGK
ncbi:MAG: hypothetical protein ACM3S4_11325 [Burkholderiales bacterium]